MIAAVSNGKYVDDDYGSYRFGESVLKVYGDGKTASIDGNPFEYTKVGGTLKVVEYASRKTVTSYSAYTSSTMTWDDTKGLWVYKSSSYGSATDTIYNDPTIDWRKEDSKFVFGYDVVAGDAIYTLNKSDYSFTVNRPEFTITMHNGLEESVTTRRVGTSYELPTPNINSNQAFLGWYTAADFSGQPVTNVTADAEVYAKVVTTYKLTVHKNLTDDGTVAEEILFNEGETMNAPFVVKDGCVLEGWFTDADFGTAYTPAAAAADVEIYAKWKTGNYTNNAANYLDTLPSADTYVASINASTDLPWNVALKNGNACICANNEQNTTASVIEVVAKANFWFEFDYISSSEANYDYLRIYVNGVLKDNTKGTGSNTEEGTGHKKVFVGVGQTLKLSYEKDSSYHLDNSIYLYNIVYAAPELVDVAVDTGEAATSYVTSAAKGATFTPEVPTRDGYAFLGWYTDAAFTTPYDDTKVVTDDLYLFAKWFDLSSQVGATRADAVSCKAGDYETAEDLTTVTIAPGQTEIWFKVEITDTNYTGGTGSQPYFYILTDNNTAFKSKFVAQESYIGTSEEPAKTQQAIYGSSYLYTGVIGDAGLLVDIGTTVCVKLTVKDITAPTTIKVVFNA